MRRVVAQGTFDILHPGHVHYLAEASAMGDELHAIVARANNVTHKAPPIVPERQRLRMVEALDPVDHARLGHPDDIFVPIEEIDPAVIVLGHDQHHEEQTLQEKLTDRGIDCEIERASQLDPDGEEALLSSGQIVEKILDERR